MTSLVGLQELVKKPSFLEEMQDVFFEAMIRGYAAKQKLKKSAVAELPGSKMLPPYVQGPWRVVDVYFVTPLSNFSNGITEISYEGVAVWMMQYFGHYQKEAIPCLKAALRDAYQRREFRGGRGPGFFVDGDYQYENPRPECSFVFELFRGEELVRGLGSWNVIGRHVYVGGTMYYR